MNSLKFVLAASIFAIGAGCSQSTVAPNPTATPCLPLAVPLSGQVLYPAVNATGVPDNASVIEYEQFSGSTPMPIAIAVGTASPIALQPTAIPSPAPSPATAATAGASVFAASLPSLSPSTNYTVYGYEGAFAGGNGSCSFPAGYAGVIGSFTSQ